MIVLARITTITKHDWSANKRVFFANFALKEALPRPVEQTEIMAMNDKPRRAGISLDDVFRFRTGVF